MKRLFFMMLIVLPMAVTAKPKQEYTTAVFHVEIHCDACVKKIQNNIAFEKGLKDMRINQSEETVTITFDPQKTDTATIKLAFEKIKKPVARIELTTQEKK